MAAVGALEGDQLDVFFVAPDWRAQRVTYRVGERIAADTRGLLGEHLAAVLADPG